MNLNRVVPKAGNSLPATNGVSGSDAQPLPVESSLDPRDWKQSRELAHKALDEALDFLESVRQRPVWQPVPDSIKQDLAEALPLTGQGMAATFEQFQQQVLPYATGNVHPRFFGWVHGTGTVAGVISEMLAATMNANCGGREHGAIY